MTKVEEQERAESAKRQEQPAPPTYHEHFQYEQHHNMKGSVSSPSLYTPSPTMIDPPTPAGRGVSDFGVPPSARSSPGLPTRTISNTRKAPESDTDFFASFGVN